MLQKNNERASHLLYRNGETTSSQESDQLIAKQIGNIEIKSGHIVACDPLFQKGTNRLRGRCSRKISYYTCS